MRPVPHALRVQGAGAKALKLKPAMRDTDLGGHGPSYRETGARAIPRLTLSTSALPTPGDGVTDTCQQHLRQAAEIGMSTLLKRRMRFNAAIGSHKQRILDIGGE